MAVATLRRRSTVGEFRSYRKFSAQQKTELVLASLRPPKDDRAAVSRARDLREPAQEVARAVPGRRRRAALGQGRAHRDRRASPAGQPARARAGPQDDGGGGRGGTLAGMAVSMCVARSGELVARVAGISRQALYRRPSRPPTGHGGDWTAPIASSWTSPARTQPTGRGWSPRWLPAAPRGR